MKFHRINVLLLSCASLLMFTGCYLSSCTVPNQVGCEYTPPTPLGDTVFRANCGKCGEQCEHLNVASESYIEFGLPQIDSGESVDGHALDHQQYYAPSPPDLLNSPGPVQQNQPVRQARKIPKTPLIEDYY